MVGRGLSRRAAVYDTIEKHLRHQPARTSRGRIRRLRGLTRPQFRLRVGEVRVFYDVVETRLEVLAIIQKSDAKVWKDG